MHFSARGCIVISEQGKEGNKIKATIIVEETLNVSREYVIEVETEEEGEVIADRIDRLGFMDKPTDVIPYDNMISYTDETDYSSPENVEYEVSDILFN